MQQKSVADFAAPAGNKVSIIFGGGVYFDKNTDRIESVEFDRRRRTNYARVKPQKIAGKANMAFRQLRPAAAAAAAGFFRITAQNLLSMLI